MRLPPLFLLLLLALPILEIATFIAVGREVGILWTLLLLLAAGAGGVMLLRLQGLALLRRVQADMNAGRMPADSLIQGAMLALAGLFLLLPGFLSDIAAFLLLLPPIQAIATSWFRRNMRIVETASGFTATSQRRMDDGVVDLDPDEFEVHNGKPGDPTSPWSGGGEPPRIEDHRP